MRVLPKEPTKLCSILMVKHTVQAYIPDILFGWYFKCMLFTP